MINPTQIAGLIQADPSLNVDQKTKVLGAIREPSFFDTAMHGAAGASLIYILTKFLGLGKQSQILLTLMGFGIGVLLLDYIEKGKVDSSKVMQYNEKLKRLEVQPQ